MKKNIFLVTAVVFSSVASAQSDTSSLQELVVTANRFAQKQATTGKVVTVIGATELARSSGRTIAELLNQQAGLTIVGAQNNLGTNQDVYLRGGAAGQTLILIDGVPAYDPSSINNAFDINHFSVENIERIEIVRGAMSTLYGSDAVAGVINIITKKSGPKPAAVYGTLAGGSFGTFRGVAGLRGNAHGTRYNLQYSRLQATGFSAAYDSTGKNNFDRDGFTQNVLSGSISHGVSKRLSLRANGQAGGYHTDLDANAYVDDRDYTLRSRNFQLGAGLDYQYRNGKLVFNYQYNGTDRRFLDDSAHVGGFAKYSRQRYVGNAHITEAYTNLALTKHLTLLAGADFRVQNTSQSYFSVSNFGPYESRQPKDSVHMNQYSVFASAFLHNLGRFHLEAGGRYNNHSEFGNNYTYTVNPSFLIHNRIKLFANFATAFKAPSLYQLFVIGAGSGQELKAETSRTLDGGIEYSDPAKGITVRAVYFTRRIENGIDYSLVNYTYFNNNLQKDHGLELEGKIRLGIVDLNANYTYVTGEVNTTNYVYDAATWSYKAIGDTTYYNLFRRPKHSVNLTVGVAPAKNWYVSAHTRIAGKRLEPLFMTAPVTMEGYHTVDLYAEYQVRKWIKAFVNLKNITNQQFFDVLGYNARRFNFVAGLNLNF